MMLLEWSYGKNKYYYYYHSTITMNAIDVTEDLDERQGNLSFVWYSHDLRY